MIKQIKNKKIILVKKLQKLIDFISFINYHYFVGKLTQKFVYFKICLESEKF